MNKIFKVIWSKARNCYVVVSELAKSHDVGHVRRSRRGCCRKATVLAAFVLTTSLFTAPDWVQAAATNSGNPSSNQAVNIENKKDATAQGTDAYATYDSQGNLIVGKDNEVVSIQKDPKTGNARIEDRPENVVLGTRNGVGTFTHSENPKKPVSEDASYDYQKMDTEWITVKVYNPNTSTYDDKQVEVYKLTPGQYMDDEYNVRAKYPDRRYYSTDEDYNKAVEVYNNVATYYSQNQTRQSYYVSGATAVGVDNVAEGNHSTAIGNKAKVLNSVSTYYVDQYGKLTSDKDSAGYWLDENGNITSSRQGYYASDGTFIDRYYMVPRLIDSSDAVALGSDVQAEGRSAVAIGHQSNAKEYSVAIGENSNTDYNAVAIGKDDRAKYASTAIGHANNADGYYTATLGVENTAHGDYSSAIGYQNTVDALQSSGRERKAYQSHAIGSENTIKGDYNLAAGDKNSIDKISGMAVGVGNKISMDHNQGNTSPINLDKQSGDYSIAVGLGNKSEKNALVIGKYSSALHDGSIAIGNSVNAQSNNNNGATDSIAIGTGSQAMTKDSIAFGHEAKIGNNNSQGINGAIAIGKGANAENGQSLAIGYDAHTGNNSDVATNQNGSIIAIGTNAQAMAGYDIAIGAKASTASSKTSNSGGSAVAIGYNAVVNDGAQRSVAMGANAAVALNVHDAVALGSQAYADREANNQGGYDPASNNKNHNAGSDPVWNSTLAAVSVGSSDHYVWDGSKNVHYAQQTRQITNVAAGKEDTDAVNVAQLKQVVNLVNNGGGSGTGGSGVHDYSVNSVDSTTDSNYNNAGATGSNALAAGVSASATGENAVAIGTGAKADGVGATVIGQYGTASGRYALAFGGQQTDNTAPAANNQAIGDNSVAFGERSKASGSNSTAFGQGTQATEKRATAFGQRTQATQSNATAFGIDTLASGQNATAFGNLTQATATGATAFGNKNQATGQYATAWGGGDKVVDNGDGTTSKIGTVASGTYATAFGERTVASGESATAFGSDSTAEGNNSLAFGEGSKALGGNSLAGLGGTAAADDSIALGRSAQAGSKDTLAIGNGAEALTGKDIAIGYGAKASGNLTDTSMYNYPAIAIGDSTSVKASESVAIGKSNVIERADGKADLSGANILGHSNTVKASGVTVVGNNNNVTNPDNHDVVILGNLVTKTTDNSVFLGSGSAYTSELESKSTKGKSKTYTSDKIGGATLTYAGGTVTSGIVSVGSPDATRRIQNVAPGLLTAASTDAVNGSQLYAVANMVAENTENLKTKGLDFQGNNDVTVHRDLGQKLTIQGEGTKADANYSGENLKVIGNTDGSLTIKMDKDIKGNSVTVGEKGEPGKNGVDGTIGVNGKDGSAVVINGRDGSIGLNGKDGANGLTIKGDKGKAGVDGTDGITRIIYEDKSQTKHEVATLDDGLKFKGDDDKVITKKLNEQLDIVGGAQGDLTDKNIAVQSTADGKLKVQMAKKLTDLTSVTTGNTTIDNSGLTIKNDDTNKNIAITEGNVMLGGNQVKNMGSGSDGTADGKPTYNTLTNGANIGDVKNIVQTTETDLKMKGLDFQGNNKEVTVHRNLGQKLTIQGEGTKADANYSGENLKVIGNTDGSLTIKMDKDIKGNSVTVGEKGEPGKNGVDGTIGVNGKDGSAVVINGRDGSIGLNGKDGANGLTIKGDKGKAGVDGTDGITRIIYEDKSQTKHEVATLDDGLKFGGDFGTPSAVKLDKQVNVKGNAKNESDLTDGNIGVVSSQDGDNGQLLVKLNKDLNLGNNGSVTMGNTTINDGGMAITKKEGDKTTTVSLTDRGLDNGGNRITNVVAGTNDTDAVNVSQLNDVKTLAGQHATVEAGSKNITVTEGMNSTGGKKYTVDLAKDVTFGDTAKGDKTVAISGTDGTITAGTGDNKVTVDGSKGQIVAGGNNGVKIGNIKNGDSSLTIYDKDGKATDKKADGGKFVTNLDNKTWKNDGSYVSGRAATEDQLHQVESNVNKQIADVNTKIDKVDKHHTEVTVNGGTVAPTTENTYSEGNLQIAQKTGDDGQKVYDLKLSDNLNIGGAGKDGKDGQNGHMGINGADGKSGIGIDGKDGISIKGKDGKDGVTIKGIDGKNGTEGHIGLTGSAGKDGQNASADIHVKNGQVGVDGTDGHGGKDGMDRVVYEDHNHVTHEVATMDDGMKYSGDSGNAAVKLNKNVQIYGGATEYADGNNIGVVASQDGDNAKLQVKLAKDLKGISSIEAKTITTGNTTMDNGGLTIKTGDSSHQDITIQQGAVNMGGNKIEGVAPGKVSQDSTDAVNGSQLWQRDQAINGLSGSVNKLGNRINRVGAGAAALAALHPLDFDPDDKWDFAAGYGNYRGANAAAVGAYYRPNEDTMFSVGGSFGGGENMVNAGVSIKLGQGNHVSTSRVAMAKEMKAMRQHMAEQDALIAKLQSMHGMAVDPAKSVLFPDVAENHWAYQYVTTLAKKGILEGYPDGEFKGDRMMTRYEFAAIVYRIVESGVGSTDPELSKLVKEFSPELQYIRIDTIQKDRDGKPTIERVRVISDAK